MTEIINDINKVYIELEQRSDDRAKAVYELTRLDEQKKSVLAKIELKYEASCKTQTQIERNAKADEDYIKYLEGLAVAKENYLKADAHYKNLLTLVELKRTREVTNRDMISKS